MEREQRIDKQNTVTTVGGYVIKNPVYTRCPICGNYAILPKGKDMCWDCYVVKGDFTPELKGSYNGK